MRMKDFRANDQQKMAQHYDSLGNFVEGGRGLVDAF